LEKGRLRFRQHKYTDTKPERIERVIADDLAFLAAHPVRAFKPAKSSHEASAPISPEAQPAADGFTPPAPRLP
jgi:hypothetical protein